MEPSRSFKSAYLSYKRSAPWLATTTKEHGPVFEIHQDGKQGRNRPAVAAEATVLSSITNAEFPHLFALREEMRNWRLLQLDPALLRRPSPIGASDQLSPDGANLAAVLARLRAETADPLMPEGVLDEIVAELNALIPGVARLRAETDKAGREYRIELTMRDGMPFSSRVVSDGTLRVLALLTLLYDPQHRGLVCFEEPENGVHPGRVRDLVRRLREIVVDPRQECGEDNPPLSQLLVNSHSPVVLSALVDAQRHVVAGTVLFADTSSLVDPSTGDVRRRTRLRPVKPAGQLGLFQEGQGAPSFVSDFEVRSVLETVAADG